MKFNPDALARQESGSREMINLFPMARELFAFAQEELSEMSFSIYTDPQYRKDTNKIVELPDKFAPLVAEYPGKYYVVGYENRLDKYYAQGTRKRYVRLSSSPYQYDSDEMLREITLEEYAPSEGKGNALFVTVSNSVNEKSVLNLNTARGQDVDQPHGSARVTYEVDSQGNKKPKESRFSRLDEGLLSWHNEQKPIRWVRNLDIERGIGKSSQITYEDMYLIGRDAHGLTEEQTKVRTHITESDEGEVSMLIEIGLGALNSAKTLFESEDKAVKVVEHSPEGMRALKNQMEILQQDPNYAFLFEKHVDQEQVMALMRARIKMLEDDWNKKQSVMGASQIADAEDALLE
ncbi:MAG: hypothetical protein RLZZ347_96 [Candidatus Parcubacteria bacterium]|jgi:hypothetical protein